MAIALLYEEGPQIVVLTDERPWSAMGKVHVVFAECHSAVEQDSHGDPTSATLATLARRTLELLADRDPGAARQGTVLLRRWLAGE
jgi:hypothetical protein